MCKYCTAYVQEIATMTSQMSESRFYISRHVYPINDATSTASDLPDRSEIRYKAASMPLVMLPDVTMRTCDAFIPAST